MAVTKAAVADRGGPPAQLRRLQPFPPVAARLMQLISSDEVVFRRVADLIRADTAFSAEILRLANSPLLGCRRTVNSILHALAILGLDRLKALVMMVALRNFLASALRIPVLLRCWRHSLATACLCEEMAAACWLDRDRSYTAGLLHDLGRLVLLASYPEEYARLIEIADESDCGLIELERGRFQVDHCELGRLLADEWEFPAEFLEITGRHHEPPRRDRFDAIETVHVGCRLADLLGFQVAGPAPLIRLEEVLELPEEARARFPSERDLLVTVAGKINALECSLM